MSSGIIIDREIPKFRLFNSRNHLFTELSLKGQLHFIYFVYGHCRSICKIGISKLETYLSENRFSGSNLILISLDPSNDRKENSFLIKSVSHWKKPPVLLFPSNRLEAEKLARSFRLSVFTNSENEIVHSDLLFITEGDGRIKTVIPDFSKSDSSLATLH